MNQKGRDILDDSRKTATGNFIKSPKKKKRKQSDGFSPKKKKRKLINKQPDGFQPNNSSLIHFLFFKKFFNPFFILYILKFYFMKFFIHF